MPLSDALRRLCLADDHSILIPAEMLGVDGLAPDLAQMLIDESRLTAAQIACLKQGFALYWHRCADLFARAPTSWFPPRRLNLLVVSDATRAVPYTEPFIGSSAMLYASDLDTHPEYVAFLLAFTERVTLLKSVQATVAYSLSWWLDRDAASRTAFTMAARSAKRPDARAFLLIANALDWISTLFHDPLRPAPPQTTEPYFGISGADLYVPKRLQGTMMALCEKAEAAVHQAVRATTAAAPSIGAAQNTAIDALCDWLHDSAAQIILKSPDGAFSWSPEDRNPDRLRAALAESTDAGILSLHADLRVMHARTQTFFEALVDPAALPMSCGVLQIGGGVYVDAARRAIVYELKQPLFDARATPAPPFHRVLLGARVMHEWGHLAHAGKILHVPEARKPEYRAARADLGEVFLAVLSGVPHRLRSEVDSLLGELMALYDRTLSPQSALARKTLARVGDYTANLMMSRLLPGEEMDAYVRINVRHHFDERLDLVSELARYAYEIQYLPLASLPRTYFYESSRFNDIFLASGLVQRDSIERLFDAVARVLDCYAVDEGKLRLPDTPGAMPEAGPQLQ